MTTVSDQFPSPILDVLKWNQQMSGSLVFLDVGTPTNGVFIHGVDETSDIGNIDSDGKMLVPANISFETQIAYSGIYSDATENIVTYFGWKSMQKNFSGNPVFGVDAMLCVKPGGTYSFQTQIINNSALFRDDVLNDPTLGADGGFRIRRVGSIYSLFYKNAGAWTLLQDVNLSSAGIGYINFGVFAEDPTVVFPWVVQT